MTMYRYPGNVPDIHARLQYIYFPRLNKLITQYIIVVLSVHFLGVNLGDNFLNFRFFRFLLTVNNIAVGGSVNLKMKNLSPYFITIF